MNIQAAWLTVFETLTYQPQPLLSLLAFCLDPAPFPINPDPWPKRIADAKTHFESNSNSVPDEDLLKKLKNVYNAMTGWDPPQLKQETRSVLLSILLTKTDAYTKALVRNAPYIPDDQDPYQYLNKEADGAFWKDNSHTQQQRDLLCSLQLDFFDCALRFSPTVIPQLISLGFKPLIELSHPNRSGFPVSRDGFPELALHMARSCSCRDDLTLFLYEIDLISELCNKAEGTAVPLSARWDIIINNTEIMSHIVQSNCAQIISYIMTHYQPSLQQAIESNPNYIKDVIKYIIYDVPKPFFENSIKILGKGGYTVPKV